jgi:hypothetical protein
MSVTVIIVFILASSCSVESFRMNAYVKPQAFYSQLATHKSSTQGVSQAHFDYNFFRDDLFPQFVKFRFDEKMSQSVVDKQGVHIYGLGNAKFSNIEQFLADSINLMEVFKK